MTRQFNGLQFDCYQDENQNSSDNEFWATREQIGRLLGYAYPVEAIGKIHNRNKERLDKFSRVPKLTYPQAECRRQRCTTSRDFWRYAGSRISRMQMQ